MSKEAFIFFVYMSFKYIHLTQNVIKSAGMHVCLKYVRVSP